MNCSAIFNILQNQFHFINLIYSIYFIWKWRHLRFADRGCFIILHFSSHKMKENFIYLAAVFNPHTSLNLPPQGGQAAQNFSKYLHCITLECLAHFYLQCGKQQVILVHWFLLDSQQKCWNWADFLCLLYLHGINIFLCTCRSTVPVEFLCTHKQSATLTEVLLLK